MKISFYTIGCKLNQAETEELKKTLRQQGFLTVRFRSNEDACVIRACAVTCNASQTTREIIRQTKKRGAYIIAIGCLENKDLPEIDYIAKNNSDIITHLKNLNPPCFHNKNSQQKTADRTRALLKIQSGCNFNCAYCIIPSFRGQSSSVAVKEIIKKIKDLEKENYKEVVLTGINICQYRHNQTDLAKLLEKILANTKIARIRLGSLDPRLVSEKLIKIFHKNSRLMPHWHLSLQSGSDSVLLRMKRSYTSGQYSLIIEKIRKKNPLFSFTTDIIVGFPGETEQEFKKTCEFIKKIGFSKVHVFPYSPRPNTPAAKMKNQIQDKIKTERVAQLIKIADKTAKKFRKQFMELKKEVLFEQKKSGLWSGYSPEYLPVKFRSDKNLKNKILTVKL